MNSKAIYVAAWQFMILLLDMVAILLCYFVVQGLTWFSTALSTSVVFTTVSHVRKSFMYFKAMKICSIDQKEVGQLESPSGRVECRRKICFNVLNDDGFDDVDWICTCRLSACREPGRALPCATDRPPPHRTPQSVRGRTTVPRTDNFMVICLARLIKPTDHST